MPLSYDELTRIITANPRNFRVEERQGGKVHVYTGRDPEAFCARRDSRFHEHKVFDAGGSLVYHRDINGAVRVGRAGQFDDSAKKRSMGSLLLWGLRGKPDSVTGTMFRNAVRWGTGGRRR